MCEPGMMSWGPLSAMVLELGRFGWSWVGPSTFQDHQHRHLDLCRTSPARLRALLAEASQHVLGLHLGSQASARDLGNDRHACVIDPAPVRSFLRSRCTPPRHAALVRSIFCRAWHTRSDLHDMGYAISPICEFCGQRDTLAHRLWDCTYAPAAAVRSTWATDFCEAVRALPSSTSSALWSGAIGDALPGPLDGDLFEHAVASRLLKSGEWQRVEEIGTRLPREPEAGNGVTIESDFLLFTDGSKSGDDWAGSERAGWGVVVFSGKGQQVYSAYGPVPAHLPQTAPVSEWLAAVHAAQIWHPTLPPPLGDCQQVVSAMNADPTRQLLKGQVGATFFAASPCFCRRGP